MEKFKKRRRLCRVEKKKDLKSILLLEEIMIEILSRVSVKSLLRFKCASKSLCLLISTPEFVQAHLDNYSNKNKNKSCISNTPLSRKAMFHSYSLYVVMRRQCPSVHLRCSPIVGPTFETQCEMGHLIGSCNGLLCTVDLNRISMWNPSTKKLKKLPHPQLSFLSGSHSNFGFGFDKANNDYKVIILEIPINNYFKQKKAESYSLKTNSWRCIQEFPIGFKLPLKSSNTFLNGALHWVVKRYEGTTWSIFSLDLTKETYTEIPISNITIESDQNVRLNVLEGCLCLVDTSWNTQCSHIWMMMEYGVQESWTMIVSISNIQVFTQERDWWFPHILPLALVPSDVQKFDKLLLRVGAGYILYDRNTGTFKPIKVVPKHRGYSYTFVESLVNLDLQ